MLANVQTAAEASGKTELLAGVEITAIAAPAVASSAPAAGARSTASGHSARGGGDDFSYNASVFYAIWVILNASVFYAIWVIMHQYFTRFLLCCIRFLGANGTL